MAGKMCKCGHREGYHSQSPQNQKFVCRCAYCDCGEFEDGTYWRTKNEGLW